jgi:hypothetical protein
MKGEDRDTWSMLADPALTPGAGLARYAAAMTFYKEGRLSAATLEEFRIHAKDLTQSPAIRAEAEVRELVEEINRYIGKLQFSQLRSVQEGLARWTSGAVSPIVPRYVPACGHLAGALRNCTETSLAHAIWRAAPILQWGGYDAYPRDEIGEAFATNHAYASVCGEAGPIYAKDFDLGIFVIGSNILYRDHKHKAPEIYAPITGPHRWRFSPGRAFEEKPAYQPVWNEPYAPHATLTGDVPFLCIYCWTRDVNETAVVIPADDWSRYEKR